MTKNTAASIASIHARLLNLARDDNRPFQEVLQYYGLERFLYRLSRSPYARKFVLKGALMLRVWQAAVSRPTRDIDLLGYVDNAIPAIEAIVRELCAIAVEPDALVFDPATVSGRAIKEGADYEGVRITFVGRLGKARIPMQMDIGFGDVVHPSIEEKQYPTLLPLPAPQLRTYPLETVVAEKFQAMVHLGTLNSRMKDFYDIWSLAHQFDFEGLPLAEAIRGTFAHRKTAMDTQPVALSVGFMEANQAQQQWPAFLRRSRLVSVPGRFAALREPLRQFLLPVTRSVASGQVFSKHWKAPGPWR